MSSDSPKPKRRHIPAADKIRILEAYDVAASALERASLMRREGVYASLISKWRKQLSKSSAERPKRGRPVNSQDNEIELLKRENERLKKRAERAEDLVETLGKVHALLQNAVDKSAEEKQRSKKPS